MPSDVRLGMDRVIWAEYVKFKIKIRETETDTHRE